MRTLVIDVGGTQAGERFFKAIGCNVCHVERIHTALVGTVINGGTRQQTGDGH